jgi:hypothetical protein
VTSKQDWASHEQGFVAIASQVFSSSRDGARQAFLKLCSWIDQDPQTGAMLAGQSNTPQTYDQVYERTHQRVLTWDLEAIFRQVALPLLGGGVAWQLAAALGAASTAPLFAAAVTIIIFLKLYPGTVAMLRARMQQVFDDIFSWVPSLG